MIQDAFISLGAWAWIILGVLLIGVELLAPGAFFLWLGLAAIVTGLLSLIAGPSLTSPLARPDWHLSSEPGHRHARSKAARESHAPRVQ